MQEKAIVLYSILTKIGFVQLNVMNTMSTMKQTISAINLKKSIAKNIDASTMTTIEPL